MKLKLISHVTTYKPWLIAAFLASGCTLSHGVDLPGDSDQSGDGDINAGDGDGDGPGAGGTSGGLGGSCPLGGAGGQTNLEESSDEAPDARLAPPLGGAPATTSCVIK